MAKKKKRQREKRRPNPWKWTDITHTGNEARRQRLHESAGDHEEMVRVVQNQFYHVIIYEVERTREDVPPMLHLSVKRRDQEAIHDWRHLQRIKNELVGKECEAVELYPADSRLRDTANQYHLWAFADPNDCFPFGYAQRVVLPHDETLAAVIGSKQRPFERGDPTEMTPLEIHTEQKEQQ